MTKGGLPLQGLVGLARGGLDLGRRDAVEHLPAAAASSLCCEAPIEALLQKLESEESLTPGRYSRVDWSPVNIKQPAALAALQDASNVDATSCSLTSWHGATVETYVAIRQRNIRCLPWQ